MTRLNAYVIVDKRQETHVFFLCQKLSISKSNIITHVGEIMRTRITLACTDCKNRNYDTTKDKKTHPDRIEMKKYCPFCKKHTVHKETK